MRRGSFQCLCLLTMMLQFLSSRCSHSKHFHSCHHQTSPHHPAALQAVSFKPSWGLQVGEKTTSRIKQQKMQTNFKSADTIPQSESDMKDDKPLIAQFGDPNQPNISPLLILPLSRRPVFPGFFATHLVQDEKTLEAIIENHKKGVTYLGLFLRKENDKDKDEDKDTDTDTEGGKREGRERRGREAGISSLDQLHTTGTYVQVHNVIRTARVRE